MGRVDSVFILYFACVFFGQNIGSSKLVCDGSCILIEQISYNDVSHF